MKKLYILRYKKNPKPPFKKGRKNKPLVCSATFIPVFLHKKDAEFEAENTYNDEFYVEEIVITRPL